MIKYKKTITIAKHHNDNWYIDTDKSDRYECFAIDNTTTPWTKWWEMQNQSDLRVWQKDIIREFATHISDMMPFMVYKRNAGHSQPHDIMLAHSEERKLWILSTETDFWITETNYGSFELNKQDSLGSVLDKSHRFEIYEVIDAFRISVLTN
jgi:hypothetical protein